MSTCSPTTVSVVVAAYQAEAWIEEALDSILIQTRQPDEVIVVDDGSTDGTSAKLEGYSDRVTIIRRGNGGCPAAFNTGFAAAQGDFVAMCGSDDIWEPNKLEWQMGTIRQHPEVDVLFGHAKLIGRIEGDHARPPATGLLDGMELRKALFGELSVCAPSVVIRRSLFDRLGPFVENFGADDYEYWLRCLRAGAQFYYDPRVVLLYRQHETNLSARRLWMDECCWEVLRQYKSDIDDRRLIDETLAPLLFRLGRGLVDDGRTAEARRAFLTALKHARGGSLSSNFRAALWVAVLCLPERAQGLAGRSFVWLRRVLVPGERAAAS